MPLKTERMIASITELNLKSFWTYLRFIPHAVRCHRQASKAPGIISIDVKSKGFLIQRTLTVWKDEKSIREYVRSGAHLEALKAFRSLAHSSPTAHFEVASAPAWEEALLYLKTHGKQHG